jgi:hypothetical protein
MAQRPGNQGDTEIIFELLKRRLITSGPRSYQGGNHSKCVKTHVTSKHGLKLAGPEGEFVQPFPRLGPCLGKFDRNEGSKEARPSHSWPEIVVTIPARPRAKKWLQSR